MHRQYTVYRLRNCSMPLSIQKTMSHANVAFRSDALDSIEEHIASTNNTIIGDACVVERMP